MRRDGGSVFPAHANTGDPNGPNRGLSANENARALISMMARSQCSNQRPDTLMQDRSPPAWRNHLQRTAGPYMWVKLGRTRPEQMSSGLPWKRTLVDRAGMSHEGPISDLKRRTI